jgi:hypothetical protein
MIDLIVLVILVALAAWLIRYFEVPAPIDKVLFAVLVVVVVFFLVRLLTGAPAVIVVR